MNKQAQSKIALVHDDFIQWGGAERMLKALADLWPEAPIYTLFYDRRVLPTEFPIERLRASCLQKTIRFTNLLYRPLFWLHPIIFESFDLSSYEIVISNTSRFAKSVVTHSEATHICYCQTPPRFLWLNKTTNPILAPLLSYLRVHDYVAAQRVDHFVANSQNVAGRIQRYYGREAAVIYPFVELGHFEQGLFEEDEHPRHKPEKEEYFLIVSRLSPQKRVDLAIEAFNKLGWPLIVIGVGPESGRYQKMAKPNIRFLGYLSDQEVTRYYLGCQAFIYPQEEDFGITALEAQAAGKPVIAYARGGALETIIDGQTGLFFKAQTKEALIETLHRFRSLNFTAEACRRQAETFTQERFQKKFLDLVAQYDHS